MENVGLRYFALLNNLTRPIWLPIKEYLDTHDKHPNDNDFKIE
ncbi:hypothetical protein QUF50_00370 [Thiotrichales bacterium HSG1]|nr:hypothetical protein [Thiotrichales bacterium HSG1]